MLLKELREEVLNANLELVKRNLVISTWGNVSGYDQASDLVVIKASGIPYSKMGVEHMVVVDMDGKVVEGNFKPSTDLPTHLVLYKSFIAEKIYSIVHTHSQYATIWAQAGKNLPCWGTTHADYFKGDIPVTRLMTSQEISEKYEYNTGKVILESLSDRSYVEMQAVLVHSHGPFVWGKTPSDAVLHSEVLEYISKMALMDILLHNGKTIPIQADLANKHYQRKFGPNSYYGQI